MSCKPWLVFLCIFVAPLRGALPTIPAPDETLSYKEWIEASKKPKYTSHSMEKYNVLLPAESGFMVGNYRNYMQNLMLKFLLFHSVFSAMF